MYRNGAIEVHWEPRFCIHTGNCVRGLSRVFDPSARPWVDVDDPDAVARTILTCPTGALHFREAAGPSELIVTKSRIAFRAPHRIFTGAFFKTHRLELFFDLPEPVPEGERDDRFRTVWEHSPTIWVHRLKIERPEELDDKLRSLLADSWVAYSKPPAERLRKRS